MRVTLLAAAVGVMLMLSGCGMLPDGLGGTGQEEESDDAVAAAEPAQPAAEEAEETEEAGGDLEPLPVQPQQVGATVHIGGMEYTIECLDVIDVDAEHNQSNRTQGARVILTGSVTNPGGSSAPANAGFVLEWEDAETGHSFESSGRNMGDTVPSGGTGPLEVEIPLAPDQLETFDQDRAIVLVGSPERSRAQAPLGSQGELITRIPVQQPGLVGEAFDVGGQLTVTVQEADLRWDIDQGTEDGTAVLELMVEVRNDTDRQQCWSRGAGNNFALLTSDGTDTVDLGMSDRGCVPGGGTTVSLTGLPVHEDYAGEYTLVLDYEPITSDNQFAENQVPMEFTMVEEPAVLLSER
ncbi:hypothetical protein [Pseudactinotalea sp. Z1748]|uniref:hypothetical protein n=1 Tax=Pseudactinotalea sp. Z1748 TaxID=3413027 RepID=UPI003C7EAF83